MTPTGKVKVEDQIKKITLIMKKQIRNLKNHFLTEMREELSISVDIRNI
eukprot:CAMPEP_0116879268 /NCGR_PEP_ID=MMETSP0463-20121206/11069_1 /TAXON_ID=181622 /ORGANISM="Strombidinopsis sp, Strain SopsisLIS2011" /LENGTH=48 /DNA_ID= /DNA_START= /DNA_END= /DNA_ORIENTATION=